MHDTIYIHLVLMQEEVCPIYREVENKGGEVVDGEWTSSLANFRIGGLSLPS